MWLYHTIKFSFNKSPINRHLVYCYNLAFMYNVAMDILKSIVFGAVLIMKCGSGSQPEVPRLLTCILKKERLICIIFLPIKDCTD